MKVVEMSQGRIPEEVIDAVLQRHDIADVVGRYVNLVKQGQSLKGLCPFHSEKTPSFYVLPEKRIYKCFGCGAGGTVIRFLMEIESIPFPEAVTRLAVEANLPVTWEAGSAELTEEQRDNNVLVDAHELAAKWYHYILLNTSEGTPAMEYLRGRGFTVEMIETFRIGYAPKSWDSLSLFLSGRKLDLELVAKGGLLIARSEGEGYYDRFRDRVMFPIMDVKGKVIAFAGRAFGDVQPKYLNSPESPLFHKSNNLYNLDLAKPAIRKTQQLVLFEGYVDTIKAWQAGVTNGVATMGTALTNEHAVAIKRLAEQVIVCYDGDNAGQNAAYKSIPILEKAGCQVNVAMLPDGLDPDEFIAKQGAQAFVRNIIEAAVPSMKYKLLYIRRNFRLQEDDGKLRYIHAALNLIAEIPLPTEREHYVRELSGEFGYSYDVLKQELNQYRQKMRIFADNGDNNDIPWNNVMNESGKAESASPLHPAHYNAEIRLLDAMMHDKDVAKYVEEKLGEHFLDDVHAALAAYLYAYYASGNEPNLSRYIATLQDDRLERAATAISMTESFRGANAQAIDDYIKVIIRRDRQSTLETKKQEWMQAERSGDALRAAQILQEMITLEKQLSPLLNKKQDSGEEGVE
jgi:DNA primase